MTDLLQQAIACHQQGRLAEAEGLYREVLAQSPDNPDALALSGLLCSAQGKTGDALDLVTRATRLDPSSGLFHLYLGNILVDAHRLTEAVVAFNHAIARQPDLAIAWYNLGNALRHLNDWEGAITAYEKTIKIQPDNAEAYNNLALSYVHEKNYSVALEMARQSVQIAPEYGEGWLTLCNVAEQCHDYELALKAGENNVRLLPTNHRAWFGYGVALNRLDRHEDAITAYRRALELKPERADIWDNLGQTYQSLNRLEEAEAIFLKTIEVAGEEISDAAHATIDENRYGNRHWHLSLIELLQGKYSTGFARYRSRFRGVGGLARPDYKTPLWQGENLNGKTILVWDEQGFGDTLMLCRYLPELKSQGAKIIFSVRAALKPLFDRWDGADSIVTHGEAISGFDYHASLFDLPLRFGTTLSTIPSHFPYLPRLTPTGTTHIKGDGRPKIGVVWGGSPIHTNDSKRSIPLAIFARLFRNDRFQFFSFNRDLKDGDANLLPHYPLIDLVPQLSSFADSARLIQQMDLVITCDTATAHLAGGLNLRVWTLLPCAPDWRWLTGCDYSPWYPTMRLFRQPTSGDWENIILKVYAELDAL